MTIQNEAALEECLIEKLVECGYERVEINDENHLKTNLKSQLEKFNEIELDDNAFNRILIHLEGGTIFDKAKKLRDKYELINDDGTVEYIDFLNSKDWCKNLFQVTNQITFRKKYENRYDVTILINGLPLVQIELKRRGIELKKAFNQIKRYHLHSFKGIFQYIQIFVVSNGLNTKYFANNPFRDLNFKQTFFWKEEDNKNIANLENFAEAFLNKCHLSKMISKYMVLNDSENLLMVLRAYQFYAVEAIINQATNTTQNGYIWHTTGSGKTLTSFKVSQILSEEKDIDKVIFVVDRTDLDTQTLKEFNKFCPGSVNGTDNTISLVRQLLGKEEPGIYKNLIVTTLQKLNKAATRRDNALDTLRDKKIILIFDECHRSHFGEMQKNIKKHFKNSQRFGFTGTPILRENAGSDHCTTARIFNKALHKYLIQNAINDNNVLKFSIYYHDLMISKAKTDVKVEAIDTTEVMESDKRLREIAQYVIDNHNIKTHNKEFNAIFAVKSIKVLTKYYKIFKDLDHDLKIATIFSFDPNEDIEEDKHSMDKLDDYIEDYNEMFGTNFSTSTIGAYYKDISKNVKEKKIDILLVVNMFLTGFDSKYLNTLYIDKDLRYHGLLQAYSRTNRIFNERKSHGNIVCFRNLKEPTDEALRLFGNENAPELVLLKPYVNYVEEFNDILLQLFEIAPEVSSVDNFPSETEKKEFVLVFRRLLRLLNLLKTYSNFSYEDLGITEDKFVDYQTKYLDLYDEVKNIDSPEKVSVIDDIDFEIELVRRDLVDAAYILNLLKDLDVTSSTFIKEKEFILDQVRKTYELKSKIGLIEKFIDENVPEIQDKDDFEDIFEDFINKEKLDAIDKLILEERLNRDIACDVIAQYEFSDKIRNDLIKESFTEELGFLKKIEKVQRVAEKIVDLVDSFAL